MTDNLDDQVDEVVAESQKLDEWKRQLVSELSDRGYEGEVSNIVVAHTLGADFRMDSLGSAQLSED